MKKHCKKTATIIALSLITIAVSLVCILYVLYLKISSIDKRILVIQQTLEERELWEVVDEN